MDYNYKSVQKWIIAFVIVILIGLMSTLSLILYSAIDKGTPVNESIHLDNAVVTLLQDQDHNVIKLDFNRISEEITESYTLSLHSQSGKKLETMNIVIEYLHEDMKEYIYKPDVDLTDVYYYKIEKTTD